MHLKTKYIDEEVEVIKKTYHDGSLALCLMDEIGQPLMTVSSNLDAPLPDDHIFVKNYSENTGILAALQEAGVLGKQVAVIKNGFADFPVCEVLI